MDDRPENLLSLRGLLESEEADLLSAGNAHEALNLLLEHDFGLALLDVRMPGMSGFELARLMRGASRTRNIPIIFVTAGVPEEQAELEGYGCGAVDFLFKPLDPKVVRSKVRVFIALDQQRKALQSLTEAAQGAALAKTRFLANTSHELRTPLTAVLGYAEMLKQENLPEITGREFIHAIGRSGRALGKLIDDVLDLSRIEAGELQLVPETVLLSDLLQEFDTWAQRAVERGISFSVDIDPMVIQRFRCDATRMLQVVHNLLANAFRFTSTGSVCLKVRLSGRQLGFLVSDTGCGIEARSLERLFEPFVQADNTVPRRYGGTGLGLAISRQIAQAMGGNVSVVSSAVGQGSTFLATFEIEQDNTPPASSQPQASTGGPPSLEGARILVVDDSPDLLHLLDTLLRRWQAQPTCTLRPAAALEMARSQPFDLVITDLQMPEIDGYEVVRQLRADQFTGPVVALTAHVLRQDMERCLAAGCNGYVPKPIQQERFFRLLQTLLQTNPA